MKTVASVDRKSTAAVDFVAGEPEMTLFHRHMQLHMDCGFLNCWNTLTDRLAPALS
jgi:Multicopper oxidase